MPLLSIFGADKIPRENLIEVKNSAPEIIIWAAPVMFFFVLLEVIISYLQNKNYYNKKEKLGSLGLGIGNVLISVWIKVALFYSTVWLYNLIPWRMELNLWGPINAKKNRLCTVSVKRYDKNQILFTSIFMSM